MRQSAGRVGGNDSNTYVGLVMGWRSQKAVAVNGRDCLLIGVDSPETVHPTKACSNLGAAFPSMRRFSSYTCSAMRGPVPSMNGM